MPVFNPVGSSCFNVFLMDAKPLDTSLGGLAAAGAGALVGIGMSALFGSFAECSGLDAEIESEEYREGGRNTGPLVFMKWGRYPNLVLKRGVTMSPASWDWQYQCLYSSKAPLRKNGIILLTDKGLGITAATGGPTSLGLPILDKLPIAVWFFSNGLPVKMQGPQLNGTSNQVAMESLEIAHEGLYRIGAAAIPGVGDAAAALGI